MKKTLTLMATLALAAFLLPGKGEHGYCSQGIPAGFRYDRIVYVQVGSEIRIFARGVAAGGEVVVFVQSLDHPTKIRVRVF